MIKCTNINEVKEATNNLDIASMVPVFIEDNGVRKEVNKFVGVYNNTQGEFCNVVTPNYKLIQHKDYITNFATALDRLNIKYDMEIKPQGNKVYVDVSFSEKKHKFEKLNEEFMTGIRLVNSYDKSTGLGIMPRYTRLACTNGMIMTRSEMKFNVRHNSKMLQEMEGFIETRLNSIINSSEELKNFVSLSMNDSIEWLTVTKILEKLILQFNHREEILKRLDISVVVTKPKNKKKEISYITEKTGRKKITRWDFYNAITHYLTHGEHITPHVEMIHQKHAERVLMTPLKVLALEVETK